MLSETLRMYLLLIYFDSGFIPSSFSSLIVADKESSYTEESDYVEEPGYAADSTAAPAYDAPAAEAAAPAAK